MTSPSEALAALMAAREQLRTISGWVAAQGQPDEEDMMLAMEAINEALAALDILTEQK